MMGQTAKQAAQKCDYGEQLIDALPDASAKDMRSALREIAHQPCLCKNSGKCWTCRVNKGMVSHITNDS